MPAAERLDAAALAAALQQLPGWTEQEGALVKTFALVDYHRVMAFVNAIAFEAHASDHHPDLGVHFNRVQVTFTTHDAGGVTALDTTAARGVERLAERAQLRRG